MEQQAVEQLIKRRIADKQERIQQIGRQIWTHAEMGFREFETAKLAEAVFVNVVFITSKQVLPSRA